MAQRWNLSRAKELFEKRGCELKETEYVNNKTPMRYIATCGHDHQITIDNFRKGKGDLCKVCRYRRVSGQRSLGADFIRKTFEGEGMVVLEPVPSVGTQPVRYIAKCGHENRIDYQHFSSGGGRLCAKCSHSVRYQYEYVRECFEQQDCELLDTEYLNCKQKLRYIAQCGHEAVISFDAFLNAPKATKRCRACHKHTYHAEPIDRNRTASKVWRKAVYARDGFSCLACGRHGGDLNAHHLFAYDDNPELRFNVDNGVTLCPACHIQFHSQYGFGGNTEDQFNEWLKAIPR